MTGDIRPDRYDWLAQLRDIVLLLSDSLTPRGVGQWLHAKNRVLGGERPIDLLTEERYEEVRGAAEAFTISVRGSRHLSPSPTGKASIRRLDSGSSSTSCRPRPRSRMRSPALVPSR
jgi:hypothetical protein